jgi:hypothetical protein
MASVKLSEKAVGSTVKLNVNGTATNFLVVHQGNPDSSVYDSSCNGTWLLMEDIYTTRTFSSSSNSWSSSSVRTYLNGTFLGLLDADVQAAVQEVKIPYNSGGGSAVVSPEIAVTSASDDDTDNGIATYSSNSTDKVFLLSAIECGFVYSGSVPTDDGATLAYFNGCAANSSDSKRVANYNGAAYLWWLRSPDLRDTYLVLYVDTSGGWHNGDYNFTCGVRPALILSSDLSVSDDGSISVTTNAAPTTPASISVPSSIMGGTSITISWGTSTDEDGNLSGYKLEKSTDGGSSWSQVYTGTATSTTDTVTFGTSTVTYRVCAYDSDGATSEYKTSSKVTVTNNTAPTAPASITVPTTVKGGETLKISWSAATDSDGNLSGYVLERSTSSGSSWSQIYKGTATSYTDTITKGWSTVTYRVKAYDPYAESAYTTSAARTVDNNTAPTITSSTATGTNLGTKSEGFTLDYTVADADGDTLTITEKVDGETVATASGVASGTKRTFTGASGNAWLALANGAHTLAVTVSDGKASATWSASFTKSITTATLTLTEPLAVDGAITLALLTVTGEIPSDAKLTVEATNNGKDAEPVWQDVTAQVKTGTNIVFKNATAANGAAFNFRITAARGESGEGGYISAVNGAFQ